MSFLPLAVDRLLPLPALLDLPRGVLAWEWSGSPPPVDISFVVACSPDEILFGGEVRASASFEDGLVPGQFVEGLWGRDVLELFVGERSSPGYLELNLAPSGAWWACLFERYRERRSQQPFPCAARVWCERSGGSWRAALALPVASLGIELDLDRLRVCAITGDPRRFSIENAPPAGAPDFHALIAGAETLR